MVWDKANVSDVSTALLLRSQSDAYERLTACHCKDFCWPSGRQRQCVEEVEQRPCLVEAALRSKVESQSGGIPSRKAIVLLEEADKQLRLEGVPALTPPIELYAKSRRKQRAMSLREGQYTINGRQSRSVIARAQAVP